MALQVKPITTNHKYGPNAGKKHGFGITDGKKWFFYAYTTEDEAKKVLSNIDQANSEVIRVNISHSEDRVIVMRPEVLKHLL